MVSEPFVGITTDGVVRPGLLPIAKTMVSTGAVVEAAAFLATLDSAQRDTVKIPVDADEWRLWCNVHIDLLRQHYERAEHHHVGR